MKTRVTIDKLNIEINSLFVAWTAEVDRAMDAAVKITAGHCRDRIKKTAPRRTGQYAESWAVKNERKLVTGQHVATVYAKAPFYRLPHLLEFPHKIKNQYGGPWGMSTPKSHIAQAADAADKEFTAELVKRIEAVR